MTCDKSHFDAGLRAESEDSSPESAENRDLPHRPGHRSAENRDLPHRRALGAQGRPHPPRDGATPRPYIPRIVADPWNKGTMLLLGPQNGAL